jgi:hypothetical protein
MELVVNSLLKSATILMPVPMMDAIPPLDALLLPRIATITTHAPSITVILQLVVLDSMSIVLNPILVSLILALLLKDVKKLLFNVTCVNLVTLPVTLSLVKSINAILQLEDAKPFPKFANQTALVSSILVPTMFASKLPLIATITMLAPLILVTPSLDVNMPISMKPLFAMIPVFVLMMSAFLQWDVSTMTFHALTLDLLV